MGSTSSLHAANLSTYQWKGERGFMWYLLLIPTGLAMIIAGAVQLVSELRGSDKSNL